MILDLHTAFLVRQKINIPVLFAKRYFRITVPLAAAILFNVGIYMNLSDGPFWKQIGGKLTEFCVDGWWTTLIYLANYLRPGKLCFGHSWYLMVDMQLYFLSPLVLYPIWRWKKRIGLMILLILTIASSSVVYIIVMYMLNGFRTSLMAETGSQKEVLVYTTAIGRLGSWMMGILVGYLLHLCEGRTIKICSKLVTLGWILTTGLIAAVIFIQYPLRQENYLNVPLIADTLYDALKPICWGLALGWIILACHLSHGNVVKRFLSLSLWLPISKLSFCIYLMHLPVQAYFLATLRGPVYFTPTNGLYHFYGNFSTSFFLAYIWALMFEYPTLKIITILLFRRRYRQQNKNISAGEVQT